MSFIQWRGFIGPPFMAKTLPHFWSWAYTDYAGVLSPDPTPTTLTSTLTDGATTAPVAAFGTYPSIGGVWIGPNGTGQGWEYVNYSSKNTNNAFGLLREPADNRDHNGVHSSGAAVRFWWPLTSAEGNLQLSEKLDDTLAMLSWTAGVQGFKIPQAAIRNNHLILIQWRQNHTDSYLNFLMGWLDSPRANDDYRLFGQWDARIVDSSELLHRQTIPGIRTGVLDIAENGSASSSTVLGASFKERASGDYIAAYPDFGASQVLNPDANAPWIGDRYIGTVNEPIPGGTGDPAASPFELQITQLYINPPAGSRGGSRWIELGAVGDRPMTDLSIFSAYPGGPGNAKQWKFKGPGDMKIGDKILLVEDEDVFAAENPSASPVIIYENEEFFGHLDPTSGDMGIRLDGLNQWWHNVAWGDGTRELPTIDGKTPDYWVGPRIPAPGQGETMRYIYDPAGTPTDPVDWWETGNIQSPGYTIDTSPDPWVQVVLPGMGLMLRDDITASVPGVGDIIYIVDESGPSNEGLYPTSTLQIGSEQITTSGKSGVVGMVVLARGANGTSAAAHAAEDPVYVVDVDGTATDGYHIREIVIERSGGSINLQGFSIKVSNLPDGARTPDDGNDYNNDYTELENVVGNSAAIYTHTLSPSRRVKSILIKIARMTTDPARPRINRIKALVNEAYFSSATWIAEGGTQADVFTNMLGLANIPNDAMDITAPETVPGGEVSETGDALAIVTSFAEYTGKRVSVQRDSKFTIDGSLEGFYIDPAPAFSTTFNRSNTKRIEVIWSGDGGVSQVKMEWKASDGSDEGFAVYPSTPDVFGTVLEVGPFLYADETDALEAAKKRYSMNKWPFTVLVECKDAEFNLRPGLIVRIQWELGGGDNIEMNRLFMIVSMDHAIADRTGSTVFTAIQIDRSRGW